MNVTQGLVIINTGKGKGKTTAALGLMLRAWGHGMKVVILQFVKHSIVGEHRAVQRMGLEIVAGGAGFTSRGDNAEKNEQMAKELWNVATEKINSGIYEVVILDELIYALQYSWLEVDKVLDVLRHRPGKVHVIIFPEASLTSSFPSGDTATLPVFLSSTLKAMLTYPT